MIVNVVQAYKRQLVIPTLQRVGINITGDPVTRCGIPWIVVVVGSSGGGGDYSRGGGGGGGGGGSSSSSDSSSSRGSRGGVSTSSSSNSKRSLIFLSLGIIDTEGKIIVITIVIIIN